MIDIYFKSLLSMEYNSKYINNYQYGEPTLNRYNLYNPTGNVRDVDIEKKKLCGY